jgi:16S rRNA (uracil1498-N3)-methyltransferase
VTRFHLDPGAVQGDRVTFAAAAAHHLGRVLRATVGDLVQAVAADGVLLSVRLTAIAPRRAEGQVVDRARLDTESPLRLTLAQAVPKGDKMEGIVRMTTELGVSRLIPLLTERGSPAGSAWRARPPSRAGGPRCPRSRRRARSRPGGPIRSRTAS